MKKLILATVAMMSLAPAASAQPMDYEEILAPLGLERAVRIKGTPCLMTTPYDTRARCGTELVYLAWCRYPAFVDGDLVCDHRTQRPPIAPTHNIRR